MTTSAHATAEDKERALIGLDLGPERELGPPDGAADAPA